MTDTDATFLPNYHNMDPARLYFMILTSSPSSLRLVSATNKETFVQGKKR
jgi:hypothetical protein